jgi:hypothetical protein
LTQYLQAKIRSEKTDIPSGLFTVRRNHFALTQSPEKSLPSVISSGENIAKMSQAFTMSEAFKATCL